MLLMKLIPWLLPQNKLPAGTSGLLLTVFLKMLLLNSPFIFDVVSKLHTGWARTSASARDDCNRGEKASSQPHYLM